MPVALVKNKFVNHPVTAFSKVANKLVEVALVKVALLPIMLSVTYKLVEEIAPATSSFVEGEIRPMPTLPVL